MIKQIVIFIFTYLIVWFLYFKFSIRSCSMFPLSMWKGTIKITGVLALIYCIVFEILLYLIKLLLQ